MIMILFTALSSYDTLPLNLSMIVAHRSHRSSLPKKLESRFKLRWIEVDRFGDITHSLHLDDVPNEGYEVSPDGSRLVTGVATGSKCTIRIFDRSGKSRATSLMIDPKTFYYVAFKWSPSSRSLCVELGRQQDLRTVRPKGYMVPTTRDFIIFNEELKRQTSLLSQSYETTAQWNANDQLWITSPATALNALPKPFVRKKVSVAALGWFQHLLSPDGSLTVTPYNKVIDGNGRGDVLSRNSIVESYLWQDKETLVFSTRAFGNFPRRGTMSLQRRQWNSTTGTLSPTEVLYRAPAAWGEFEFDCFLAPKACVNGGIVTLTTDTSFGDRVEFHKDGLPIPLFHLKDRNFRIRRLVALQPKN
ncbi:hypothetical protein MCEMSE15_00369 [Fimbriimonadaceae bacterium]